MGRIKREYALYKGDELLAMGTKEEIAKKLGIKRNTVEFYGMPAARKRIKGKNGKILIRID